MSKAIGEGFEVLWAGKRDHCDFPLPPVDLLVKFPQLREMLLAIESTEVAEEHQNGRTAEKPARGEGFAVDGQEIEVEVDPHADMMLAAWFRYVIRVTEDSRRRLGPAASFPSVDQVQADDAGQPLL